MYPEKISGDTARQRRASQKELEDGFAEYNDAYAEFEEKIGDAEAEFAEAREFSIAQRL